MDFPGLKNHCRTCYKWDLGRTCLEAQTPEHTHIHAHAPPRTHVHTRWYLPAGNVLAIVDLSRTNPLPVPSWVLPRLIAH